MTSYLIEASICMAGFYGFYWLFLHREKLLSINRFYLLITSALALIIPLLNFKYTSSTPAPLASPGLGVNPVGETFFSLESLPITSIYLLGLGITLLLFLIRLYKAGKHLPGVSFYNRHQPAIVEIPGKEAYSFFNTIYIGKDLMSQKELRDQILRHEMAHVKDLHFLDLMYFELIKCIFWFNPFPYFYSKSIKLQHEYIADQQVLAYTSAETYEQSLLRFTLSKIDNTLIAAFGQHPIQQRLNMIYKLNSNIMNKLKPLLCLPILAVLFVSYSCEEEAITAIDTAPEVVESESVVIRENTAGEEPIYIQDGEVIEVEEIVIDLDVQEEEVLVEELSMSTTRLREITSGEPVDMIEEEVPVAHIKRDKVLPKLIEVIENSGN